MKTLTKQKPLTKGQGQKRQKAQQALSKFPKQEGHREQVRQEEVLYAQVRQDEALRAYHTAKLLETPGYTRLREDEASEMVGQMLRLSCLLYEMLLEQGQTPLKEQHSTTETASNHGTNK